MTATFKDFPLELLNPSFDSPLMDVMIELEHLRKTNISGSTPNIIFYQIKKLFHLLESLGSARIEGNRTTISEYLELVALKTTPQINEQLVEIQNLEKALEYIDSSIHFGDYISESFIRELQLIAVNNLTREGDKSAGQYRNHSVYISGSSHQPPEHTFVPSFMRELVEFINKNDPSKYDLMKVALVHHRFGWIHPFGNGNGRTVRLLTYAMLIKYGFNVGDFGRILNPTAVFCCDREQYYSMLSQADTGTKEGLETWCTYVLDGILSERRKLDTLMDYSELKTKILNPALSLAKLRGRLAIEEYEILKIAINKGSIAAADVAKHLNVKPARATYLLKKLRDRNLLLPILEGKREYALNLAASELMHGIIDALNTNGLIPDTLIAN